MYTVRFKGINGKEKILFTGTLEDCYMFWNATNYIVGPDGKTIG